ncbi:MAG: hypothetical protein RLZZ555_1049 [Pseudomonadota bacterium]|jgi:hypothetical protein
MHSAPSVEYPAGRSAFQARIEGALALAWLGMQAAWWLSLEGAALPGAWWFSGLLGLVAWLVQRWRARSVVEGRLSWEPAARRPAGMSPQPGSLPGRWVWRSEAYRHGTELASLRWSLDLQQRVLLQLRNAAGISWWVWLECDRAPADWQALREALVAWRELQQQAGQRRA